MKGEAVTTWNIQTVDSTGDVGWYSSLALDSLGYPHISYYDWPNDVLKYASWNGSDWDIQTVDSTGAVGLWTSLALDSSDNPHISYYDMSNGDLKYATALAHDIALTSVTTSKTVVGQGYTCSINATAVNTGISDENFAITTYAQAEGTQNGLKGYWGFDQTEGTLAIDLSGNNNHATFSPKKAWEWTYQGDTEGWTATYDVTDFSCDGTSLNGKTTDGNPNIDSPSNLGVDAAEAKTIHIRMNVTNTSTAARIYFITEADPVWDSAKSKFFALQNADQWVEYTIDMFNVSGWEGTVTQIKLVPCQTADTFFEIDWLRIGSSPTWKDGKFGSALDFDGYDDRVSAPFIPLNDRSFTVTAWINARTLPDFPIDAPILSQFDSSPGGTNKHLHIVIRDRTPMIGFYGDSLYGNTPLNTNTWYHLAFVYNNTAKYFYIYVNGQLDTSGSSSEAYKGATGDTEIGRYLGSFFDGLIDEVRIYDRTLTQQEIRAVASSGAIQTETTTLSSGSSAITTYTWNTTGWTKGNYTISAYAWPVTGETDLTDNNFTDSWIQITKVGDLGGLVGYVPTFNACDGKVDGIDLALFIQCYKKLAGDAQYVGDLGGPVNYVPTFYACDGKVDGIDLALFIACYKGLGPPDP